MLKKAIIASVTLIVTAGCSFTDNRDYVANKNNGITVAKAQSQLQKGMSGSEVVTVMGSPNMVSTNKDGNETWVYDKISTVNTHASAGGSLIGLLNGTTAASSQTQKTLTIIVKFDANKTVNDIQYHQSSF